MVVEMKTQKKNKTENCYIFLSLLRLENVTWLNHIASHIPIYTMDFSFSNPFIFSGYCCRAHHPNNH